MNYLERLKASRTEKHPTPLTDKTDKSPPPPPCVSFVSSQGAPFPPIEDQGEHFRFSVEYPDGSGFDVVTSPAATLAEARELWPGANVRPSPEDPAERATKPQAYEIRELLAQLVGARHPDYLEAVDAAMTNPAIHLRGLRAAVADVKEARQ